MSLSFIVGCYVLHATVGVVYSLVFDPAALVVLVDSLLPERYPVGCDSYRRFYDHTVERCKGVLRSARNLLGAQLRRLAERAYPIDEEWEMIQHHDTIILPRF